MAIDVYDVGDLVRVTAAFTNTAGTATDPTAVTLKVIDPSGNEASYAYGESPSVVEKSATGGYYADLSIDEAGDWHYQWLGTGTVQAVEPGQFVVQFARFA